MSIRNLGDPSLRASGLRRSAALALAVLLIGAACGSAPSVEDGASSSPATPLAAQPTEQSTDQAAETEAAVEENTGEAGSSAQGLADKITPLPPAPTGLPFVAQTGPRPIGLTIGSLDVNSAGIISVGVEDNGDMEIPPADQVGWYEFGAKPGDERGSSVLAAHIAFDGEDGVFVELDDIELGTTIQVSYDDGSVVEFVATSKEQYDKNELPKESIFDRSGAPQLVLITCGGDFNESVRSYDDNVVVYATEVGSI